MIAAMIRTTPMMLKTCDDVVDTLMIAVYVALDNADVTAPANEYVK